MKENHGETNGQYKRERRKRKKKEKKEKKYYAELKQGKRITVKQMGSIRGKDTVKH